MKIEHDSSKARNLWRGKCMEEGPQKDKWITGLFVKRWNGFWSKWSSYIIWIDDLGRTIGEFEVYPNTVGSYTGIDDYDNKNCIFDGDIIQCCCDDECTVVKWEDTSAAFVIMASEETFVPLTKSDVLSHKIRVVGNIYDNPELLENGESTINEMWDNAWKEEARKAGISEDTIQAFDEIVKRFEHLDEVITSIRNL